MTRGTGFVSPDSAREIAGGRSGRGEGRRARVVGAKQTKAKTLRARGSGTSEAFAYASGKDVHRAREMV